MFEKLYISFTGIKMKRQNKYRFLVLPLLFIPLLLSAQSETHLLRQGNKLYEQKKYKDAEINYRKAGSKSKNPFRANYNLGNSMYKQNNYNEAASVYRELLTRKSDKKNLAKAYHNLGNSLLQDKKYEESIKSYKNALRINPKDNDTKYNLEFAKRKLLQKQQQQKQKNNNKQDKKQNDPKQDKQQPQQQKQQQQKQISKEDAERMLQALKNDEKNTLEKLKKQNAKKVKVAVEKDW
jgi:tetratricopeptide (TPR) repeat protein